MSFENAMEIEKIRRDVEDVLFKIAQKEWDVEKASNYSRIELFANPHALAFLQAITPLSSDERDALLTNLPKRSYMSLRQSDPGFFRPEDECIVNEFVRKFSQLAMPFFSGHDDVTSIWEEHDTLISASRDKALQIERLLATRLRERHGEWGAYVLAEPEPHMISYERSFGEIRIIVDFDLRHWAFFCGVKLFRKDGLSLISNYTFLGSLGISSAPAWYVDEASALKALTVCEDHAMQAAQAVARILEKL